MNHNNSAPMCVIPFATSELLWSWDISSDLLWLSHGAQKALNLPLEDTAIGMGEFLSHVPPSSLPSLHEMREGVLNGTAGSRLEVVYPFDKFQVQEFMLVLSRGENGRATRIVGHYVISEDEPTVYHRQAEAQQDTTGMWVYDRVSGVAHHNAGCSVLLGMPDAPATTVRPQWQKFMHQDDHERITLSFTQLLEPNFPRNSVEHVVRIQRETSSEPMRLWGTVLSRDEEGHATMLGGTLSKLDQSSTYRDLTFQDSRRLLFAVNSTGDGLWDWDASTDNVYFSPRYLSMLGYTAEEFPSHLDEWKLKIHPDDYDKIVYPQAAIVESPLYGETFECTYRLLRKDGTYAWILGRGYVTHRDVNGRATRLVGMHTDITAVQTERERLEELVKNDILTGLRSRTFCNLEIERIERNRIRPLCVFSIDLNGLKLINDTLGHAMGDKLLSVTALLLRTYLRATDCVARMGGDEFTVLLPGCTQEKGRELLAQVRRCFLEYNASGANEVPARAAFGMATTNSEDVSVAMLLRQADAEMMNDKNKYRKENQRFIKEWIEEHTGKPVDLSDCRLLV